MTDGILIRPIEPRDSTAWAEMWAAYAVFYKISLPEEVTAATWARIIDPSGPIEALLATDFSGDAVGFANYLLHPYTWSDKPTCYLEDLYVRPEARRRGVGRALIDRLVVLGRERGWGRLYWTTQQDNATARRLYDRFGPADDVVRYTIALDETHPTDGEV